MPSNTTVAPSRKKTYGASLTLEKEAKETKKTKSDVSAWGSRLYSHILSLRASGPRPSLFQITELVLPTSVTSRTDLAQRTRFEFPFNNPKKCAQVAYAEIKAGLDDIADITLLFLSHLESIEWRIGNESSARVRRFRHSDNHIEVQKESDGRPTARSHFLRFSQAVTELTKQRVSIAFALDYLPDISTYDHKKPISKQLKIIPAVPGLVAVLFPADKETSGLRFHIHGPFVPELSRASVKNTPANEPLFSQLAVVAAESLHGICGLGLLNIDFLSVLPNPQDAMPPRYHGIRTAIIAEMNNHALTPTYDKSHAPAKQLLQAKASLKDLLSAADVEFLLDCDDRPLQWAIGATQKNSNADRFLSGLAIADWDVDKVVEQLSIKASEGTRYRSSAPYVTKGPDQEFMAWLECKPGEWHQKLYALLYAELSAGGGCRTLRNLKIVRLSDATYQVGNKCFFPSNGVDHDAVLPRVDATVYASGKSRIQQENARKFLEELGVREVGEAEQVEAILKQRYTSAEFHPTSGIEGFVPLVETNSDHAALFTQYFIFEGKDEKWHVPSGIFLDSPFLETGLAPYYEALGCDAKRVALADSYNACGVPVTKLVRFAKLVGVQTELVITSTSCSSNPEWEHLCSVGGGRHTSPIDRDYTIVKLKELLATPSLAISKLIWRTMSALPQNPSCLHAVYQKNQYWGSHQADSQLVHTLREASWVPQGNDSFVRPADASRDELPEGFAFDSGWLWLKAVHFGEQERRRVEEHQEKQTVAKELGFTNSETLERAKEFAALPEADQERILAEFRGKLNTDLPEHEPRNPERRAERVAQQAGSAPEKTTEERTRSVSVGREDVKQLAAEYLREQYTTDSEMICQICRSVLPFKLRDGSYYFEKVEFLEDLRKRYYQNYLALCPNHSAMFQHVNGSRDLLRTAFVEMDGQQLTVILADADATIYFTKTHVADLRQVINVDGVGVDVESESGHG